MSIDSKTLTDLNNIKNNAESFSQYQSNILEYLKSDNLLNHEQKVLIEDIALYPDIDDIDYNHQLIISL